MLGKNNFKERLRRMENQDKHDRFSIRKLSIGVASVLIGFAFMVLSSQTTLADTITPSSTESSVVEAKDNVANNDNQNVASNEENNQTKSEANTEKVTQQNNTADVKQTDQVVNNDQKQNSTSAVKTEVTQDHQNNDKQVNVSKSTTNSVSQQVTNQLGTEDFSVTAPNETENQATLESVTNSKAAENVSANNDNISVQDGETTVNKTDNQKQETVATSSVPKLTTDQLNIKDQTLPTKVNVGKDNKIVDSEDKAAQSYDVTKGRKTQANLSSLLTNLSVRATPQPSYIANIWNSYGITLVYGQSLGTGNTIDSSFFFNKIPLSAQYSIFQVNGQRVDSIGKPGDAIQSVTYTGTVNTTPTIPSSGNTYLENNGVNITVHFSNGTSQYLGKLRVTVAGGYITPGRIAYVTSSDISALEGNNNTLAINTLNNGTALKNGNAGMDKAGTTPATNF